MKNDEFEELRNKFKVGQEVKIRYYTYNKNDYIDIIGKIVCIYSRVPMNILINGNHYVSYVSIQYIGTYKVHDNFTGKNLPQLQLFNLTNDMMCCYIMPHQIASIKPTSLRAYKIHQLRNRNN